MLPGAISIDVCVPALTSLRELEGWATALWMKPTISTQLATHWKMLDQVCGCCLAQCWCCWSLLYRSLFSILEQTHCSVFACDSKWATVAYYSVFFNIHWSGILFGCYMAGATYMKLLLSLHMFCVHHMTMYQLQCHFMQSHIDRVHVYSAVTCHLHFWQNDWHLSRATMMSVIITTHSLVFLGTSSVAVAFITYCFWLAQQLFCVRVFLCVFVVVVFGVCFCVVVFWRGGWGRWILFIYGEFSFKMC